MSARYIPPHMRPSNSSSSVEGPTVKVERKPEDGYTLEEISHQYLFYNKSQLGTLNRAIKYSEEEEKSSLGFVIVFKGQHPRWPPKIFCKTNLFLLPKTDTLPSMSSIITHQRRVVGLQYQSTISSSPQYQSFNA